MPDEIRRRGRITRRMLARVASGGVTRRSVRRGPRAQARAGVVDGARNLGGVGCPGRQRTHRAPRPARRDGGGTRRARGYERGDTEEGAHGAGC